MKLYKIREVKATYAFLLDAKKKCTKLCGVMALDLEGKNVASNHNV